MKKAKLLLIIVCTLMLLNSCSGGSSTQSISEKIDLELSKKSMPNYENLINEMENQDYISASINLDDYDFEAGIYPKGSVASRANDLAFFAYRLYYSYYDKAKTGYATQWLKEKSSKKMLSSKDICLLIPIVLDGKPIGVTTIYENKNYNREKRYDSQAQKFNISDTIVDTGYMQSLEYIVDKAKLAGMLEDNGITKLIDIKYISGYADGGFADFIYLNTDKGEYAIPYIYIENTEHNGKLVPLYDFLNILAGIEAKYPNGYTPKDPLYYIIKAGYALIIIIPIAIVFSILMILKRKLSKNRR